MKNLKLAFILSSVFVLAVIGCKKGDAGPAGAPGPAGPDSVIYSSWITLQMTEHDDQPNPGDTTFDQQIAASAITQDVLDKGVILSYVDLGADGHVFPTSSIGFVLAETFTVGQIELQITGFNLSQSLYRYVIMKGTIQANKFVSGPAAGMTVAEVKSMSYNDVLKLGAKKVNTSPN